MRESYVSQFVAWFLCFYIVVNTFFGTGWIKKMVVSQLEQLAISLLPSPLDTMLQMMVNR